MSSEENKVAALAVDTLRMLAVDAVEKANSGHPGAPMGLAQIAYEIFTHSLRYDPTEPDWPDRDRFVLSCGHASMLLYGMLHLAGYDVSLDDLKSFRQWGSNTPGHPEVGHTPGVECTTGPLGQGIATAVGMALGLKMRAARFSEDFVGARVFGIASDGDLMEGVSGEASSFAGHLGLDNLVFFYDDNGITIDGSTDLAFSEDVGRRYGAYGWFVQRIDGHDGAQIRKALDMAVAEAARPSLIIAKTVIGYGAPTKAGTAKSHGSPLGAEESEATKEKLGWPADQTFFVPDEVRAHFAERAKVGRASREAWEQKRQALPPDQGAAWKQAIEREIPDDLLQKLVAAAPTDGKATRNQSGVVQQTVAELVPYLVGGSADLTGSTKTWIKDSPPVQKGSFGGRNLHYGVREFGMAAVMNGMTLNGDFVAYGATFLVFSDYLRPALRLSALSKIPAVYVLTHDSLYLGEDGPTHQPVEHYWALRNIPNVDFVRPADGVECAAAWAHALRRGDGPTAMALSRQGMPHLERAEGFDPEDIVRGGYVLSAEDGPLTAVVIATGSEVSVALGAKRVLGDAGRGLRVVSMPCVDAFERQPEAYRQRVLGPVGTRRASIELGVTGPWRAIVGERGLTLGHDSFGHSAKAEDIAEHLGFVPETVAAKLTAWLG
ncbi:MAG: transketolase [Myxococcota bacterium]